MATFGGPNITFDNLVFSFDLFNDELIDNDDNILNPRLWSIGTGNETEFSDNGLVEENHRIIDTDPFGNNAVVWEARPESSSGADGGWNGSRFSVDETKMYRFSTWVKRTVKGNGHFYLGTRGYDASVNHIGVNLRSTGTNTTNPYFEVNNDYNEWGNVGDWYLVVGHMWPSGSGTGANHTESGIYDINGNQIDTIERDYVWVGGTVESLHRSYLYYSTDISTRQQWAYPRVDVIDGSEPSIQDLIENRVNDVYARNLVAGNSDGVMINNPLVQLSGIKHLEFDDFSKYIEIPHDENFNFGSGSFSISGWINLSDRADRTGQFGVFYKRDGNGGNADKTGYYLEVDDNGVVRLWREQEGIGNSIESSTIPSFSLNTWYHIIGVADASDGSMSIYANGELLSNTIHANFSDINVDNTVTGLVNRQRHDNHSGEGKLGNVYVHGRALTSTEIKNSYDALKNRFNL